MPTSQRSELVRNIDIPGPGQYSSQVKSEGPAYTLRSRRSLDGQDKVPGPGQYNPGYNYSLEKPPSFTLGTAKRNTSLASNRAPGPGNYNHKNTLSGPNWGFGSSARSVSFDNTIPGPGSYSVNPKNTNISFSMTPRRSTQDNMLGTPGPGTYNYFLKEGSPKFSLSKSKRKSLSNESLAPGPGAYSPEIPKSNHKNTCN